MHLTGTPFNRQTVKGVFLCAPGSAQGLRYESISRVKTEEVHDSRAVEE
jgi:hypothetical protein